MNFEYKSLKYMYKFSFNVGIRFEEDWFSTYTERKISLKTKTKYYTKPIEFTIKMTPSVKHT